MKHDHVAFVLMPFDAGFREVYDQFIAEALQVELPRLGGQPVRGDHGSPYGKEEASIVYT
jgi:hypothetical protein